MIAPHAPASRLPLLPVLVGLLWLGVLLAYSPSRNMLLAADALYIPLQLTLPVRLLVLLGQSLLAGWAVVAVLRALRPWRRFGQQLWWSVVLAWFAIVSWYLVQGSVMTITLARSWGDVLKGLAGTVWSSLVALPSVAFYTHPEATWILFPLGFATLAIVRWSMQDAEAKPEATVRDQIRKRAGL